MDKIRTFFATHFCGNMCSTECFEQMVSHLSYDETEICKIEVATRGQYLNKTWYDARTGLLTASNFRLFCHCTDGSKTAADALQGSKLNEQFLPAPVKYGRDNEEKARQLFLKSHRYHHRACSLLVPGFNISSAIPFLGCSADGVITCKQCGKFLIEVKCMWSKRKFHPRVGAVMSGICDKDKDGQLVLKANHKYYYQIQGQVAITGVLKAFLVLFINKAIESGPVECNADFWESCTERLSSVYRDVLCTERKFNCKC